MTVICAWCGISMGEKPPFEDRSVSHGVCLLCEISVEKGWKRRPRRTYAGPVRS